MIKAWHGDSRQVLDWLQDDSIDSCVTDPPYALTANKKGGSGAASLNLDSPAGRSRITTGAGFMGKQWDTGETAFDPAFWAEVLRVLKPGAHLLAFGGTRSYHRLACAIEDAGFEIRDAIMWHYGSGFPKSHDVSKGIDKTLKREGTFGAPKSTAHAGWIDRGRMRGEEGHEGYQRPWMQDEKAVDRAARQYEPASSEARAYKGWGTALKPATEIICVARKPLSEGTVAANVLLHGTGAINVDGCRVEAEADRPWRQPAGLDVALSGSVDGSLRNEIEDRSHLGRWPANVIHDGSEEVLEAFAVSGPTARGHFPKARGAGGIACDGHSGQADLVERQGDTGTAARFYYCAKASKADRADSKHPTVKPVALLRYLTRLITPPGGCVLDPFAGSGTIATAAAAEGFDAVLIEREAEYYADISRRIATLQFG